MPSVTRLTFAATCRDGQPRSPATVFDFDGVLVLDNRVTRILLALAPRRIPRVFQRANALRTRLQQPTWIRELIQHVDQPTIVTSRLACDEPQIRAWIERWLGPETGYVAIFTRHGLKIDPVDYKIAMIKLLRPAVYYEDDPAVIAAVEARWADEIVNRETLEVP